MNAPALQLSLGELELLSYFPQVRTLILTGGNIGEGGYEALYSCNTLEELVLDYEETDSDEEGIQLEKIPNIQYVLTRSNLNINNIQTDRKIPDITIINIYKNGKCVKYRLPPSVDICRPKTGVFFSTEALTPAGALITKILNGIETYMIDHNYMIGRYTEELDNIAIIPVCTSSDMIKQRFYPERKNVSLKRREADFRLHIDYELFCKGTERQRKQMCLENIEKAVEILKKKTHAFNAPLFLEDVKNALELC